MLGLGALARKVFGTPNDRKVKSIRPLVAKINDDIVLPKHPKHLSELTTIAEVLYA